METVRGNADGGFFPRAAEPATATAADGTAPNVFPISRIAWRKVACRRRWTMESGRAAIYLRCFYDARAT